MKALDFCELHVSETVQTHWRWCVAILTPLPATPPSLSFARLLSGGRGQYQINKANELEPGTEAKVPGMFGVNVFQWVCNYYLPQGQSISNPWVLIDFIYFFSLLTITEKNLTHYWGTLPSLEQRNSRQHLFTHAFILESIFPHSSTWPSDFITPLYFLHWPI